MTLYNYAFVKNNIVLNIGLFEDPSSELLEHFKNFYEADEIVLANEKAHSGGEYDGEFFWRKQPHPSWTKNYDTNEWQPPVLPPDDDKNYGWDEQTLSWICLDPPIPYPEDGQNYRWDIENSSWVVIEQ